MKGKIARNTLRDLGPFAGLSDDALDQVARSAEGKRYQEGEAVFEQGQPAEHFYVLLHGRLRVTQVTADGQQVVVRMINPGDLFGIAKAIRRTEYPGTATAVTESVALGWPMSEWDSMIQQHPSLAPNVLATVGGRLMEAHQRMRELATEEVERRVAHAVLRLANQAGQKVPEGIRIDFPISKQDIAEMTGTTLHMVSRILSAWEAAGLVESGRRKLLIRDPHRLVLIGDGVVPGLH